MRLSIALLVTTTIAAPCLAQNFPDTLVTTSNAVACRDPEALSDGIEAHGKKNLRALNKAGCLVLRPGMQVRVEYAQRVGKENYHLIRVSWRRAPSRWAYSYSFK
jgi:hypothetical protein